MAYELIYGTVEENESGMLDSRWFETEEQAMAFVKENEPEVAQLNYPDGSICVISE